MKLAYWMLLTLLISIMSLSAAFLTDVPQEIIQPDGSVVNCFASGDEFHNWLHDANNYTIIQNIQTGFYTYAIKNGSQLLPSEYIAGKVNPQSLRLTPGLNIDLAEYKQKRQNWWQDAPRNHRTPTSGNINNLVVYIRFSDQTEFTEPFTTYNTMFNSTMPNTNSMYNYFMEDSYQALTINTTFYPLPVNHMVVSYQDSLPRPYFLPYSSTNTLGYSGDTERREREHALLVRAVQFISTQIPPALVVDADNDGKVDNVCFIVKGSSGSWANLLWPHMWSLYTYEVFLNGARVYTYNFQLENSLTSSGVGVLCHEMSHSLGMPDLYHYTSNGISPVGRWDLMESNRNPPQHHTAYMKSRYTDWLPPMRQITESGTYWINKMLNPVGNCYKIMANNPQYHYVVEFRKKEGFFENSIPGTGLLVYRVDSSEHGNADGPPDELYVYRPGGTLYVNGTINSAPYSSELYRTAINESTNPSPFLTDGTQGGLDISQIGSSAGDSISFYINVLPPPPIDYDEGFESGDFSQYPWSFSDDADWIIDSLNAYEGNYCAKSGPINHLQSTSLSLAIDVPAEGFIGFYKKTSSESGYDYIKFYIDDIQKSRWSGETDWSYTQYPVTPGTHVFKWSYTKDQGVVTGEDCAWIDNIAYHWEAPLVLVTPQNLNAVSATDDIAVDLSWTPPVSSSASLMGYRIFKNEVQIADIDTSNISFRDYHVIPNLSYSYFIKAFYSSPYGHSLASDTISVLVTGTPIIPILTSAEVVHNVNVHLTWMLPDLDRGITGYYIYRNGALVHTIDDVLAQEWIDGELHNGLYRYYISSRYPAFSSDLSNSLSVTIDYVVDNNDQITTPLVFGITKCYPNPFSSNININYCIDKDNIQSELCIYNVKGQKVRTLMNGKLKSGNMDIEWNGKDDEGISVSSGIYYCRLKSSSRISYQRLLLIK